MKSLLVAPCLAAVSWLAAPLRGEPDPVAGQLILRFKPGVRLDAGANVLQVLSADPTVDRRLRALPASPALTRARVLFPHYAVERAAEPGPPPAPEDPVGLAKGSLGRHVLVEFSGKTAPAKVAEALAAHPDLESAEPNFRFELVGSTMPAAPVVGRQGPEHPTEQPAFTPNDPAFPSQWGLTAIHAPAAWDLTQGSANQVIAVIDTGVDLDHPDLASKIWTNPHEAVGDSNADGCPGICGVDDDGDGLIDEDGQGLQPGQPGYDVSYYVDDDENGYKDDLRGWDWIGLGQGFPDNDPQDDNGHGTHCAGIAAAATNNGIGGAGTCPLCRVMTLKAFQSSGTASYSDIALAIDYAYRNGATVLSMSFAGTADSSLVRDALSLAYSRAVLVAAAGNNARRRPGSSGSCGGLPQAYYPAHYSYVLGVEAATDTGALASFSNCGYEVRNPGVAIYSTVLDDTYATWSGTSMAAPFVAGTAGLLRAYRAGDPAWTPDLVFGQMVQTGGDALQALTLVPTPNLTFVSSQIVDTVGSCPTCDGDGVADSGETVDIVVMIRNLWGNATAVNGTLSTSDSLATILQGSSTWGNVGPAAFDDNANNPFRLSISSSAGNNRDIVFNLAINAGNGGTGISRQIVLTIQRGIEKGGIMTASETWTKDNLYLVTQNLRIDPGATLTIQPGTRIQVSSGRTIMVYGELVARGTPAERIVFTGNPSDWGWIDFRSSLPVVFDGNGNYVSGPVMEYCVVEGPSSAGTGRLVLNNNVYVARNILRGLFGGSSVAGYTGARFERNLVHGNSVGIFPDYEAGPVRYNTIVGNLVGSGVSSVQSTASLHNNNVFSNAPYDAVVSATSGGPNVDLTNNYWGTTDPAAIAAAIWDFFDDPGRPVAIFTPFLAVPVPEAPPVVASIALSPSPPLGAGPVTFTVTFSKPMNTSLLPEVFFGPAEPYTTHPVPGQWVNSTTWSGQTTITPYTGDGIQRTTVVGAQDPEGFYVPPEDHRFSFEIDLTGTSASQLMAVGATGHVDLTWFPSDIPDLAGYNVYRSNTTGGPYTKLNSAFVAGTTYSDYTALPGVVYHYVYRVMSTALLEGPNSDEAAAAAIDTIAPVITHTPATQAPANQILTLLANITDNIGVTAAHAYYRPLGGGAWTQLTMLNATGSQYTANIPSADMQPPGIRYYLEASDGVNTVYHGTATGPHVVAVGNDLIFLDGFE